MSGSCNEVAHHTRSIHARFSLTRRVLHQYSPARRFTSLKQTFQTLRISRPYLLEGRSMQNLNKRTTGMVMAVALLTFLSLIVAGTVSAARSATTVTIW